MLGTGGAARGEPLWQLPGILQTGAATITAAAALAQPRDIYVPPWLGSLPSFFFFFFFRVTAMKGK